MKPRPLSPEHRISCHRCGNIRKRRILCSRASCPHTFCGRCSEKLKEEHGVDVFFNGCPVCKELCCCSNKSVFCHRKNHCYRKCPATKTNGKYCNATNKEEVEGEQQTTESGQYRIFDLLAAVADLDESQTKLPNNKMKANAPRKKVKMEKKDSSYYYNNNNANPMLLYDPYCSSMVAAGFNNSVTSEVAAAGIDRVMFQQQQSQTQFSPYHNFPTTSSTVFTFPSATVGSSNQLQDINTLTSSTCYRGPSSSSTSSSAATTTTTTDSMKMPTMMSPSAAAVTTMPGIGIGRLSESGVGAKNVVTSSSSSSSVLLPDSSEDASSSSCSVGIDNSYVKTNYCNNKLYGGTVYSATVSSSSSIENNSNNIHNATASTTVSYHQQQHRNNITPLIHTTPIATTTQPQLSLNRHLSPSKVQQQRQQWFKSSSSSIPTATSITSTWPIAPSVTVAERRHSAAMTSAVAPSSSFSSFSASNDHSLPSAADAVKGRGGRNLTSDANNKGSSKYGTNDQGCIETVTAAAATCSSTALTTHQLPSTMQLPSTQQLPLKYIPPLLLRIERTTSNIANINKRTTEEDETVVTTTKPDLHLEYSSDISNNNNNRASNYGAPLEQSTVSVQCQYGSTASICNINGVNGVSITKNKGSNKNTSSFLSNSVVDGDDAVDTTTTASI